jgi:predicted nucleic acid-binding protein
MKVFIDANLLIYLNATTEASHRRTYDDFYTRLATDNRLYTDILILDDLLYISKKRYGVPNDVTKEFIDDIILPITGVSPLGLPDYKIAIDVMNETQMKPSDATHVASMRQNDIKHIASEDHGFDKVKTIKRIWLP